MESEFVRWLRTRLPSSPWLRIGPGDDAAVLQASDAAGEQVVTCDLFCDGVHFRVESDNPRRIGRKALAANLSDLAAMAATPVAGFFAVALPRDRSVCGEELYEGILPLAEEFSLAIAGGDTNVWDGPLVISITLIGRCASGTSLLRSGARPGDHLLVTGQFGGSLLGHQFDFQPRVREALWLHEHYSLHAGIDCSDGLLLDASRMAEESGCGVVIDLQSVPIADAAVTMANRPDATNSAMEHALADGEDFELLLAVPENDAQKIINSQPLDVPLSRIGTFIEKPGLWQATETEPIPLEPRGFLHGGSL